MPKLVLGTVELSKDSLAARVFRNCINPSKGKQRKKVSVHIDQELLQKYEEVHPRQKNHSFGGQLSDDCNKSLVVWLQVHDLI
jgi:hypothetical protein